MKKPEAILYLVKESQKNIYSSNDRKIETNKGEKSETKKYFANKRQLKLEYTKWNDINRANIKSAIVDNVPHINWQRYHYQWYESILVFYNHKLFFFPSMYLYDFQ